MHTRHPAELESSSLKGSGVNLSCQAWKREPVGPAVATHSVIVQRGATPCKHERHEENVNAKWLCFVDMLFDALCSMLHMYVAEMRFACFIFNINKLGFFNHTEGMKLFLRPDYDASRTLEKIFQTKNAKQPIVPSKINPSVTPTHQPPPCHLLRLKFKKISCFYGCFLPQNKWATVSKDC